MSTEMSKEEIIAVFDTDKTVQEITNTQSGIRYVFRKGKQFTNVNMFSTTTNLNFDYKTWENISKPFTAKALVKWIREYEKETMSE